MRSILLIVSIFSISLLSGCFSPNGRQDADAVVEAPRIVIPLPTPGATKEDVRDQVSDVMGGAVKDIKNDIQASSNNTQNQLSGLVTASVSKVADKLTGVEADLKDLINFTATMNNTVNSSMTANVNAQAEMKAKLEASLTAVAEVKADLKVVNEMKVDVRATLQASNEMKADLGKISANAQLGIANSLKDIYTAVNNTAGRDVNYLPREAVYMSLGIMGFVAIILLVSIVVTGYNSRIREKNRTSQEKENVERWQAIALKAIAALDPEKARGFSMSVKGLMKAGEFDE